MFGIMNTSSYSRVIVPFRLIAIFFAECLQCPTITENSSDSNPSQIGSVHWCYIEYVVFDLFIWLERRVERIPYPPAAGGSLRSDSLTWCQDNCMYVAEQKKCLDLCLVGAASVVAQSAVWSSHQQELRKLQFSIRDTEQGLNTAGVTSYLSCSILSQHDALSAPSYRRAVRWQYENQQPSVDVCQTAWMHSF